MRKLLVFWYGLLRSVLLGQMQNNLAGPPRCATRMVMTQCQSRTSRCLSPHHWTTINDFNISPMQCLRLLCDFQSTLTLPSGPSPLLDLPITPPEPSQPWSPRLSDDTSATDNGLESFLAQGPKLQRNAFDLVGKEETGIIKLLIFVFVLAVICMPFSRVLGDFYTSPLGVFRTC